MATFTGVVMCRTPLLGMLSPSIRRHYQHGHWSRRGRCSGVKTKHVAWCLLVFEKMFLTEISTECSCRRLKQLRSSKTYYVVLIPWSIIPVPLVRHQWAGVEARPPGDGQTAVVPVGGRHRVTRGHQRTRHSPRSSLPIPLAGHLRSRWLQLDTLVHMLRNRCIHPGGCTAFDRLRRCSQRGIRRRSFYLSHPRKAGR